MITHVIKNNSSNFHYYNRKTVDTADKIVKSRPSKQKASN